MSKFVFIDHYLAAKESLPHEINMQTIALMAHIDLNIFKLSWLCSQDEA